MQIGDWCCQKGHWNALSRERCGECDRAGDRECAGGVHLRARDQKGIVELREYVKDKMIKEGLRRPKSDEAVRAAKKSKDEVLRVRESDSDRGMDVGPSNARLSANDWLAQLNRRVGDAPDEPQPQTESARGRTRPRPRRLSGEKDG